MAKYIEPEFTLLRRKQIKFRSRERRDTHIEIQCHVASMEDGIKMHKEFEKATRRVNRLLRCKFSYELTITFG